MPIKDCLPFIHPSITTAQLTVDEFEMEKNNKQNYLNRVDYVRVKYLDMITPNLFWMAFKDDNNNIWKIKVYFPNYQLIPVIKHEQFKEFLEKYLLSTANQKGCHLLYIKKHDYEKNFIEGELYNFNDSKKEYSLTHHLVLNAKAILVENKETETETKETDL